MATLVQVAPGMHVRADTPRRVAATEETIKRLSEGRPWLERVIRETLKQGRRA